MAAGVVQPGLVQDPAGRWWVTAAAACADGERCRYGPHRASTDAPVGPDVTCKMIRAWVTNPGHTIRIMRPPGGGTWYSLDDLRNAEHAARTGTRGRPRRHTRPQT